MFVNVVNARSTDSTFKTVHAKLETAAKKSDNGSLFARGYPFNRPPAGMHGVTKGVFSDLQFFVGVAIDPNGNDECLTRRNNGLFTWIERTMIKLEGAEGVTTLQEKQTKMVICMVTLLLNLMLDSDDSLSQGSFFEGFINNFNLPMKSSR